MIIPLMISVLKDKGKSELHRDAMVVLSGYGAAAKPALPLLIPALEGETPGLAAQVLGRIGPGARDALPALRSALREKKSTAREELILAIIRIDPASVSQVDELLEPIQDFSARAVVLGSLGRVSPEGLGLARIRMKSLEDILDSESPYRTRPDSLYDYNPDEAHPVEYVISQLGALGPSARAAIPKLITLLNHRDLIVRSAARRALGEIEMTSRP